MENIANTEQAEYWNAEAGREWVEHDEHHDRLLRPFTVHLLDAAAVVSGVRVVDVGCGCGHTTRAAAGRAAPGDVLGLDISAPMVDRARQLAAQAGLVNVRFEQADAQAHRFPAPGFDVVISRFGVMFFADPVAAFANIATALDEGGRLVFVCWQGLWDNPWIAVPLEAALRHVDPPELGDPEDPGPFSLADAERIRSLLAGAGYVDVQVEPVRELLWVGDDPAHATGFLEGTGMARTLLGSAPPDAAARAVDAIRAALEPYATEQGVLLGSSTWLVTATHL